MIDLWNLVLAILPLIVIVGGIIIWRIGKLNGHDDQDKE